MAAVKLPFENPHVTLNDEVLNINYRSKKVKVVLINVCKIYLSKRKTSYLSALFGNLHITRNTGFKLYIHTKDNNLQTLDITSDEKYQFVSLISWVRNQIKERENMARQQIKRRAAVPAKQAVAA